MKSLAMLVFLVSAVTLASSPCEPEQLAKFEGTFRTLEDQITVKFKVSKDAFGEPRLYSQNESAGAMGSFQQLKDLGCVHSYLTAPEVFVQTNVETELVTLIRLRVINDDLVSESEMRQFHRFSNETAFNNFLEAQKQSSLDYSHTLTDPEALTVYRVFPDPSVKFIYNRVK